MGYTADEQKRKLRALGYDPDQYEILPADEAFGGTATPENQGPLKPRLESSVGGAFLRGAKRAIIPAAAGTLAAASTLKFIPTPVTQAIGWPATVLAPIVAGMATGAGAAAAQEKLFPSSQEEVQQRQADVEQHPFASMGGELAPGLMAFKPSLSNLRTAFRRLPALGASEAEDAVAAAARREIMGQRLNVGLGAGLGALQETALPLIQGEDIDPKRLLMATLGGAAINEPNRIGRRLGFHASDTGRLQPRVEPEVRPAFEPVAEQIAQDRAAFGATPEVAPAPRSVFYGDEQGNIQRGAQREVPRRGVLESPVQEPPRTFEQPPIEGTPERRIFDLNRQLDEAESRLRTAPLSLETLEQRAQLRQAREALQVETQKLQQAGVKNATESITEPGSVQLQRAGVNAQRTPAEAGAGNSLQRPAEVAEQTPLTPEQQQQFRFQQESVLASQPLEQLLAHPTNKQVFDLLVGMAAKKNISTAIGETDGALGMADLRERVAKLNPKQVAEDTHAHEIAHILLNDMLRGPEPVGRQLAESGLAIFGGNEERLVQALGTRITDMAKIRVEGRTLARFKAWLQDAISWMKKVWGNASEEDFRRLLARRMMNGDTPAAITSLPEGAHGVRYQRLAQTSQAVRDEIAGMLRKANEVIDKNLRGFRSVIESVAERTVPRLAKGLSEADRLGTRYQGDFSSLFEPGLRMLNADEQQNALDYLYNYKDTQGNPTIQPMNDVVQEFVENVVRPGLTYIADMLEAHGKMIVADGQGRKMKRMPWYFQEIPRQDVIHEVTNNGNSAKAKALLDDMYEHISQKLGISKEAAADFYNDSHHAAAIFNEGESDFGPISRAAGIGLPQSWRENSLQRALLRYARRSGRALGFFQGLERDQLAGYLAGIKDQFGQPIPKPEGYMGRRFGDDREVINALKYLRGDYEAIDQYIGVISQAAKAGMLQTMTGLVDVLTGWVHVIPNMLPKDLPILAKSFKDVGEGVKKAVRMGVASDKSMMLAEPTESGQQFTGVSGLVQKAHKLADAIYKITGRDAMERWIRGWTFNNGELLAWSKIGDAFSPESSAGDRKAAVLFLRDHAPEGWEQVIGDAISRGEQVPESMIQEIAASVVEKAQGTYSIRGLPSGALRGSFAPFLSLAKWNIEKWNSFNKQVIGQARRGNLTPLLMVTVGGVIGGEAVEKLREAMTKRKPQHATWDEIFNGAGDDLPYRLFALASYSGYGGILTEIGKQLYDVERGVTPQGFKFPAVELTSNIFHRLTQGMQALDAGENPLDVFALQLPLQLAKDNVQLARIGIARTDQGEHDIERANTARDVRIFRRATGRNPRLTAPTQGNPFVMPGSKDFDITESPQEAAALAPALTQKIYQRAAGDPEKLRSLLTALRTPTTDIVPNIRTTPLEFAEYVRFIRATQGDAAAQQMVQDYQKKEALDRFKSRLIPRLR